MDTRLLGDLDLLPQMPAAHAPGTEHVYREVSDGEWWQRTLLSCIASGLYLIAFVLYLDGTWLTKSGNRKAKPLCLAVANHPGAVFRSSKAKRIICQVPEFPCTKKDFKIPEVKTSNRQMYHGIFTKVCAVLSFRNAKARFACCKALFALCNCGLALRSWLPCVP